MHGVLRGRECDPAQRLGLPERVDEADTRHGRGEACHQVVGHGACAVRHGLEAGQVCSGEVGMVDDAHEHRRHDEGQLHAVSLDEPEPLTGVEPRLDDERVAADEADEGSDETPDVVHGHTEHAHLRCRWVGVRREPVPQCRLGHRNGLGQPRRAAGEQHDAVVTRTLRDVVAAAGHHSAVEHRAVTAAEAIGVRRAGHPDLGGAGQVGECADLLGREPGIHECGGRPDAQRREHAHEGEPARCIHDRHAIAGSYAGRVQRRRSRTHRRRELGVRPLTVGVDECDAVGPRIGPSIDDRPEVETHRGTVAPP